jgi:hypothetical protein
MAGQAETMGQADGIAQLADFVVRELNNKPLIPKVGLELTLPRGDRILSP